MQGHIVDALVDLTSYTAEKYDLSDPEVKAMVNDGRLWNIFLKYSTEILEFFNPSNIVHLIKALLWDVSMQ